ncbi:hypothetical protein JGI16_11031 [Candidatus Kryptonium thompsonii]|nr:hypothetical protein JGI16_11031 [Candidatus Kryptonium thompsoni]
MVDKFSGGKLKEKDGFEFLLSIAIENNLMDLIDEIAFHSKFLWRVFSFLKSGRKFQEIDEEIYKGRIVAQINETVEKIRNLILRVIDASSEDEKRNFVQKFLGTDMEGFENFINLVHDFYWLKNWKIDGSTKSPW